MALDDVRTSQELEQAAFFTPDLMRDIIHTVAPEIDPPVSILNMLALDANKHEMGGDNPAAKVEALEAGVRSIFENTDYTDAPLNDTNITHIQATLNLILSGADGAISSMAAQQLGGTNGLNAEEKEKKRAKQAYADIALAESATLADIPIDPVKLNNMGNYFFANATQAQKDAYEGHIQNIIKGDSSADIQTSIIGAADSQGDVQSNNPTFIDMSPAEKRAYEIELARKDSIDTLAQELERDQGLTPDAARAQAEEQLNPEFDKALETAKLSNVAVNDHAAARTSYSQSQTLTTGAALGAFATSSDYNSEEASQAVKAGSLEEQLDGFVTSLEATIAANGQHAITLVERSEGLQDKVDQLKSSPIADNYEIRMLIDETVTQIQSIEQTLDRTANMNSYLTEVKDFIEDNKDTLLNSSPEEMMSLAFENEDLLASYQEMVSGLSEEERHAFIMETAKGMGVSEEFAQDFFEKEMANTEAYFGFKDIGASLDSFFARGNAFIENTGDYLLSLAGGDDETIVTSDDFIRSQNDQIEALISERDSLAQSAIINGGGATGLYYQSKLSSIDEQIGAMEDQLLEYKDAVAALNEAEQAADASAENLSSIRQELADENILTINGDGNENYYVFLNQDGSYSLGSESYMDGYREPTQEELLSISNAIENGATIGNSAQKDAYTNAGRELTRNQTGVTIAKNNQEIIESEHAANQAINTVNEIGAQQAAADPDGLGIDDASMSGMGRMSGGIISPIATTQDRIDYQMEVAAEAQAEAESKRQEVVDLQESLKEDDQAVEAPSAPAPNEAQLFIDANPEYIAGLAAQNNISEADLKAELELRGVPANQIENVMSIAETQMNVNVTPKENTLVISNQSDRLSVNSPPPNLRNTYAQAANPELTTQSPAPQEMTPEEIKLAAAETPANNAPSQMGMSA